MTAFYNEIDPFAAATLRNLIAAGHIAPGIVDERPIQEIEPYELVGFTQCHFFAGVGVWSHALRKAGWADDRPIWTGSCPCQPFSNAGQKKGFQDDRHLWPYWKSLIDQRAPSVVVGEQVASALDWLDLVSADMERANYAFGASDLCAAGFGGAHIRQRLYFVGLADALPTGRAERRTFAGNGSAPGCGSVSRMADADDARPQGRGQSRQFDAPARWKNAVRHNSENSAFGRMADAVECPGQSCKSRTIERVLPQSDAGTHPGTNTPLLGRTPVDWLYCRDGKWRPVEPGTFPLVDAAPARVGRLRAYGNALDAETAAEFCSVVKEICDEIGV